MDRVGNEKGFALILTLVIMSAMTIMVLTSMTISQTDMYIARNLKESKLAFYLAETGLDEAMARMDLAGVAANPHARSVGETSAHKDSRIQNKEAYKLAQTYAGDDFDSSAIFTETGMTGMPGTYSVNVSYTLEDGGTWCDDEDSDGQYDDCDSDIVLYGEDFGFSGDGVPLEGFNPVYVITSTGTTTNGTQSSVRTYVTSSSLNVLPPNDTITFVEGGIESTGAGGIDGRIASTEGDGSVFGCSTSDGCENVSFATMSSITWNDNDMDDYLGLPVESLRQYADHIVSHSGNSVHNESVNDGDWGTMCSTDTADALTEHICENEAALIFIDNADAANPDDAWVNLQGGVRGRGLIVVTGNLRITGGAVWEGMIYVMGRLDLGGGVTIYGTMMVDGDDDDTNAALNATDNDLEINGGLTVRGSQRIAASVGDIIGIPKILRWSRI